MISMSAGTHVVTAEHPECSDRPQQRRVVQISDAVLPVGAKHQPGTGDGG